MLCTLYVKTSVIVLVASGPGIPLLSHTLHALVGYCALAPPLTVILVGAFFAMGAYRIGPVCIVYGTLYCGLPAATVPAAPPLFCGLATLFCVAGPDVPVTAFSPAWTAALNWPVMEESVKRSEKLMMVPPVTTPMVRRK